jgi:hypothetical protein
MRDGFLIGRPVRITTRNYITKLFFGMPFLILAFLLRFMKKIASWAMLTEKQA